MHTFKFVLGFYVTHRNFLSILSYIHLKGEEKYIQLSVRIKCHRMTPI